MKAGKLMNEKQSTMKVGDAEVRQVLCYRILGFGCYKLIDARLVLPLYCTQF